MSLLLHRQLITNMCRREVLGRYRGSFFGVAWSFVTPLFMLLVYTFFFSVVFKAKWQNDAAEGHVNFAVILFAGLMIHGFFSECLTRAPSLISGNVSYVKKVVFPLEILSIVAVGAAIFHFLISVVILLLAQLIIEGGLPLTALLFPIVVMPIIFMALGLSWMLAALGAYVRDIAQVIGLCTTVLLFVSPVFYPVSILPREAQVLVMFNPLTLIIEELRKVLLYGVAPNWTALAVYTLISIAVACLGFYFFQKARRGFADVL